MIAPPPAIAFWGDSLFNETGEAYGAFPVSLMEKMGSLATVVGAILKFCNKHSCTNCRDRDLVEDTGLSVRVIQRVLHRLEHVFKVGDDPDSPGFIGRARGGGRRVITINWSLIESKESLAKKEAKAKAKKTAPSAPAASSPAPAGPPAEPAAEETPEQRARGLVEMIRMLGYEPVADTGQSVSWEPIPGQHQSSLGPWAPMLKRCGPDVRRLIDEQNRPALE